MTRVEFFYIKKSMFTHYFLHYEKYIYKKKECGYFITSKQKAPKFPEQQIIFTLNTINPANNRIMGTGSFS